MAMGTCPHTGKPTRKCTCADTDPTSPYYAQLHATNAAERQAAYERIQALEAEYEKTHPHPSERRR